MGKARKKAEIDPAEALQARAAEDSALAAILDAIAGRLRLWRLCPHTDCKRAQACRRGAVACGAWRVRRPVSQAPGGDQAPARKIIIQWRDPRDDAKP